MARILAFPGSVSTGSSSNSFSTIQTPLGTSPVASSPTDTLTFTSSDSSVTITGNSSTDTIDFKAVTTTPALTNTHIFVGNVSNVATDVALSGDATLANTGALTLNTVNSNVGTFGSSTSIPTFTVNAKGLITAASGNVVIAPAGTLTGTTLASNVVTSSLTSLGIQSQILDLGTHKITNVTDPSSAQDAATKAYVDAGLAALNPADACYAATTANLVGTYNNGVSGVGAFFTITATGAFTLDGTTPPVNSRILIKDQTSGFQNGVYNLTVAGGIGVSPVLTRSLDYNTAANMNQAGLIPIINGTVNALSSWQQVAAITTVGTDSLVFSEFTANPSLYLLKANNLSDVANKTTSFNNLSPMTTGGDIIYGGASGTGTRLANGTVGQVLTSGGTTVAPSWTTISSGGAPTGAQYVTLALDGTLTAERVLTGTANQVIITDNGANSTVVLSLPQSIATSSSPTFTGLTAQTLTLTGSTSFGISANCTLDNATGNEQAYTLAYTTNKLTSGNDIGLYINKTDTSSPGTSYLLFCQTGASGQFWVDDTGNLSMTGTTFTFGTLTSVTFQNVLSQPILYVDLTVTKLQTNPVVVAPAVNVGSLTSLTTICPAHTIGPGAEVNELLINMSSTKTWTAGTPVTLQRSLYITSPTYAVTALETMTEGVSVAIAGPPAGVGAINLITSIGFKMETRNVSASVQDSIGFVIYAPTGAFGSNACGSFMGGAVGINTLSPQTYLDIRVTTLTAAANDIVCIDGNTRYPGMYIGGTVLTIVPGSGASGFILDFGYAPTSNSASNVTANNSFFYAQGSFNQTGALATGSFIFVADKTGGTLTAPRAIQATFNSTAASTHVTTTARSLLTTASIAGSGAVTTYVGVDQTFSIGTGATVTTGAGIRVGNPSNSGTITNWDALLIEDNTATVGTRKTSIRQLGTTQNRFVGPTSFGSDSTPTAKVHIAAGSTAASSAPIKLTSGTVMTAAEAGAIEFTTDDFFATITTGAVRKAFILDDGTRLTSGRVPFATTNGRLTDDSDLTFATDTLTATKVNIPGTGNSLIVDTTTLVVDATNNRVGIGTASPGHVLHILDGNIALDNTGTAGELRFYEPSGSGTNYSAFKAQAQAGNVTYTLPAADGSSGQFLSTNASGTLSWATAGGGTGNAVAYVKTAATTSVNNTFVDDGTLAGMTLATNSYVVEGYLLVSATNTTPDFKFQLVVTTSTVNNHNLYWAAILSSTGSRQEGVNTATSVSSGIVNVAASGFTVVRFWGALDVTNAGSLALQWSQNTTSAGNPTQLERGSWIKLTKM